MIWLSLHLNLIFCAWIDLKFMDPEDTPRVLIQNNGGRYEIETATNSAELDLTIGPRYDINEVRMLPANYLGRNTSGVLGKQNQTISNKIGRIVYCALFHFAFIFSVGTQFWHKHRLQTQTGTVDFNLPCNRKIRQKLRGQFQGFMYYVQGVV